MIFWSATRVAGLLGTPKSNVSTTFTSVSTDTRTLCDGALFVALVGERFDGHDYLDEAASRGAAGVVVLRGTALPEGPVCYEVEDTARALGQLARARRAEIRGPVVAVTGTNGKTSTKEMLASALSANWSVHATRENFNNLIGVPLTILEAPMDCDALVVEVGANQRGEISRLRDVVQPSIGVVTNVGHGHLEGFGSFDGVLEEKASLLDGAPVAVVGTEPPELAVLAERRAARVITAGLDEHASFSPESWSLNDQARGSAVVSDVEINLPVVGYHQIENLVLVLAVARELGLDLVAVAERLEAVSLPPGRCEVLRSGELTVLNDAYNSNPGSLKALLKTASAMQRGRKLVLVLGSMLELGDDSAALHAEMADCVMEVNPHIVAVMGDFVRAFERYSEPLGDRLIVAPDSESLGRAVAGRFTGDELVLVKGSRGVHLDRAVPFLLST